jgi:hypothetical protein
MPVTIEEVQGLIDGALNVTEVGSFCIKRACDEIVVHRQMQKRAADVAPQVLALMVKTGAIRKDQEKEAAAMLGGHAETLRLLFNAVEKLAERQEKRAGDLGHGVDDPAQQRAYDSLTYPVVGHKTSQKKASDAAILKVLDPPTSVPRAP